jgi:ubiquinone/menaquinone biosynthesis C-methylase UbiE
MANLAGPSGTVVAADIQHEMLAGVRRRAERAGVMEQIRLHRIESSGLQFEHAFDFALAFWMLHEVPDEEATLRQIHASLKTGGRFLLVEPRGHVSGASFARTVNAALRAGFTQTADPRVSFSRALLLAAN